jgi:Uma2 family endonuclease
MSALHTLREVEYPESDGQPVAETEVHLDWMFYIHDLLKWRYRGQRVYVGCDLMMYYVEGDPRKCVSPDHFVVKDCDPRPRRRTFLLWKEGRAPNVVFEVTSLSTRKHDEEQKPDIYRRIGVKELFLYDPTAEYLDPPLQGFRFVRGKKTRIKPDETGALESRELGLLLRLENEGLVIYDARTGERLLTQAESERAAHNAERAAREAAEALAADEAEARRAAEAELKRLRDEVARLRSNK